MADNTLGLLFEISADPSRAEAALERLQAKASQTSRKQASEWEALARSASAAFNQMAGVAQTASEVMLRAFEAVAGGMLRQMALQQLSVAETAKAEGGKAAITLKAIREIAIVRAIEETAEGVAALARFQFHKAALHFLSAAKFGAVAATEIAPLLGGLGAAQRSAAAGGGVAAGAPSGVGGPPPVMAPGSSTPPRGNVTVIVMGEPQAAAWMTKVINHGVIQQDLMLVASHTKRSAPAGR